MKNPIICAALVALLGIFTCTGLGTAQITANPVGLTVSMNADESLDRTVTLTNSSDNRVAFTAKLSKVDRGRQLRGPRRDEVNLLDYRFAAFQDQQSYGFIGTLAFEQIDNLPNDIYQNCNLADAEIEQYAAIIIAGANQSQNFYNQYADNLALLEEYLDGGGALYIENGPDDRPETLPPGEIRYEYQWEQNGNVVVSANPEANNYSPLAELMGWQDNAVIHGNAMFHCHYAEQSFQNIDESDWYQVIAVGADSDAPGLVAYNWGAGMVLLCGAPVGYVWANYNDDPDWGSAGEEMLTYLVESVGVKWISVEPKEGTVGAGRETDLTFTFNTEGLENGTYEEWINLEYPDLGIVSQMSAVMTVGDPTGDITGVITDAETGEPIANATAALEYYVYERHSNDNGEYGLANLPLSDYDVLFTAPDYLPTTRHVDVADGGARLNVEMLHAECNLSIRDVDMQLAPDAETEVQFSMNNGGNGPLVYTTDRRLLGDANASPWEVRRSLNVGADLDDDRIEGVAFDGENFYFSGAAGDAPNSIYVVNRDGDRIGSFNQIGNSRYGMKDLEFDGENLWGSGEQAVFAFDTDGNEVSRFNGPFNPVNNIAYDPENEVLWLSGTTTNISAYDRNGNALNLVLNRKGLRIYGLSYWPDDPDGYNLYIVDQPAGGGIFIHKMNTENGDTLLAYTFENVANVSPGGIFVTNTYDVYSWVLMAMQNVIPANGGDRFSIMQLDARRDWFDIAPREGRLAVGASQDFTLSLNATGLPTVMFEAEIVFNHDGVHGSTHLPITLNVVAGPVQSERDIQLAMGWNLISANLQPDPADFAAITRPLANAGLLKMVKDDHGNFMSFGQNQFNNLPDWSASNAYYFKVDRAAVLEVAGMTVMADDPIHLEQGWQSVAYYPRRAVPATLALSGIVDQLNIAKDGLGNFYMPAYGFENIGDMHENVGYLVRMNEATDLVYRTRGQQQASVTYASIRNNPGIYPLHPVTGSNMSLLIEAQGFEGEIGVYANGLLVGTGRIDRGRAGVAVWGDDPTTAERDGAVGGDLLEVRLMDQSGERSLSAVELSGSLVYQTDAFTAVRTSEVAGPETFAIAGVYPNPFNGHTTAQIQIPASGKLTLAIFDLNGRLVREVASGRFEAGKHSIAIDANDLASGVYLLRANIGGMNSQMKIALLK